MQEHLSFHLKPPAPQKPLPGSALSLARSGSLTGLFEDILQRSTILQVKVTGKSMYPSIQSNDIVFIKKVAYSQTHLGDLLLFKDRENGLILHRLLRKHFFSRKGHIQTKGDALSYTDEPVPRFNILGRVIKIERKENGKLTVINMNSAIWRTYNMAAAIYFFSLVAFRRIIMRVRCPFNSTK